VIVGAEGPGLSPGALAAADRRVRIPIVPDVDSLNVATAAAIAFHALTTAGASGTPEPGARGDASRHVRPPSR
jgi:tRNA G18 (ribose-2'-O)-methylase SpoU